MNKIKVVLSVVILVIAIAGAYVFPEVQGKLQERLGASPGPDRQSQCESTNGVRKCWERQALRAATTTPCNIRTTSSTSTIDYVGLNITTSTSTNVILTLATSTVPNATTTPLFITTLASGQLGQFGKYATSSSGVNAAVALVTPPNTYISWGAEGFFPADTTKLNGFCQAEWTEL